MAIFGKKNNDNNDNKGDISELDAMIMSAIDEATEEEAASKEEARKEHLKQLEEARKEAESEKAAKEYIKSLPNGGRRYFLLVESTKIGDNEITVTGNIHGEIKTGDELYIYRPGGAVITTKADVIKNSFDGSMGDAAKNARIDVTVSIDFEKAGYEKDKIIPKFSVVSGIKPTISKDNKKPFENPALLGISLEYATHKDDRDFQSVFVTTLANSSFVVPVSSTQDEIQGNTEDGKKKIKFKMLNDGEKVFLPIFADWSSLKAWKELYENGNKPGVIVVSFMDLAKITAKEGPDFMLDAYGPVAIHLPRQLISNLVDVKEKAEKKIAVQKQVINGNEAKKILVTEPLPTKETKEVVEALRGFAKGVPSIASFGLLCKVQAGKRGYLVIVDCPKEAAKDIYLGLFTAAKPYMKELKSMDFSLYSETVFADDYFAKHTLDYVRLGNY